MVRLLVLSTIPENKCSTTLPEIGNNTDDDYMGIEPPFNSFTYIYTITTNYVSVYKTITKNKRVRIGYLHWQQPFFKLLYYHGYDRD
jgi:hypothetical protein